MRISLFLEYPLATPSWQPCFDTVPIKNVWLQQRDHVGCGVLLKLSGNASRLFQIAALVGAKLWAFQSWLQAHHTLYIRGFVVLPITFLRLSVSAAQKVVESGFPDHYRLLDQNAWVFSILVALIFKLPRGCDYLHQGAPQFPSNLLCCEISESEWPWDSVSAGYIGGFRSRAAAKLPNPGGNWSFRISGPGSFRIKAHPSFRIRASMSIWSFQIRGPESFQIRARRSFQIRVVAKFLSPRAWEFPNESSCKLSNLPLKFPNPGGGEFPNLCARKFPNPTLKFPNPKLAILE